MGILFYILSIIKKLSEVLNKLKMEGFKILANVLKISIIIRKDESNEGCYHGGG